MSIPVQDILAIEKAGDILVRALNGGDISSLSDFCTANAVVLAPARAPAQGSGVLTFWRNMAMQNEGIRLLSTEMEQLGSEAVRDTGTLSLRPKRQSDERNYYKYLMVWQKVGGNWKLSSMAWNRAPNVRRDQNAASDTGGM